MFRSLTRFFRGGPIDRPPDNSLSARVDRLHQHRDQVLIIADDIQKDLDKTRADVDEATRKLVTPTTVAAT